MAKSDEAYVNGHPWTAECRQELQALTLDSVHRHIPKTCFYAARQQKAQHVDKILTHYKTPADRERILSYLYPDALIPGCGRWRCSEPKF